MFGRVGGVRPKEFAKKINHLRSNLEGGRNWIESNV